VRGNVTGNVGTKNGFDGSSNTTKRSRTKRPWPRTKRRTNP